MLIEYNVKIPKERIAVLIGKQAEIKKKLAISDTRKRLHL